MKANPKHPIADVFEIETGSTPSTSIPAYWNGTYPWITPTDLSKLQGHLINDTQRMLSKAGLENCSANTVPEKSIIISTRAPIGYVAVLGKPMAFNQGCKALVPKVAETIDSLYIYYQLLTKVDEMNRLGSGSTFKEISKEKLGSIKITLPPLPIQKRIAAILEKADAAREKRRQANQLTEQFLQSTFLEMFGDPVTNPKGWEVVDLESVCEINPRMTNTNGDDFDVTFVPMSAVDDVEGGIVSPEIRKYSEVRKGYTYFKNGDVLFAKITPCMENGKAAVARNLTNDTGFGSTEFHVIRPGERILSDFIFGFIRRDAFRKDAAKHMGGTAGQQRVPTDYVKQVRIIVPPFSLQQKFAALVEKVEALRVKQRASEMELENLFQSLMQRAFKGDLV